MRPLHAFQFPPSTMRVSKACYQTFYRILYTYQRNNPIELPPPEAVKNPHAIVQGTNSYRRLTLPHRLNTDGEPRDNSSGCVVKGEPDRWRAIIAALEECRFLVSPAIASTQRPLSGSVSPLHKKAPPNRLKRWNSEAVR